MYLDDSWFWPLLDQYRDRQGRSLEAAERAWVRKSGATPEDIDRFISRHEWQLSPKSEAATRQLIALIQRFHDPGDSFTYLEFGTCFATTILSVLRHFPRARGIGLERNPARFQVGEWLARRVTQRFHLADRVTLQQADLLEARLSPDSVDVVFMDTDHRYPDDYEYMMYLLDSDILRSPGLFIGDDPLHTGTRRARERLAREQGSRFDIITRPDWNLWWCTASVAMGHPLIRD